jgi:hypothetical protein
MVDITVNSPTNTVPYHQQDTTHWCGSACALMVLHYLGVTRAGGFPLDQKRVRMVAQNSARSDPTYQWVSPPDGLTSALNYFCERSDFPLIGKKDKARRWELVAANSEEEISRYIVWTLWHYRTPAIALVFGMQHWVVVGGCVTSRPPKGPDDTGYEIIGFHLSDPWPPIPRELARNDHFRHMDRRDHTGSFVVIDGCGSGWGGDPNSDTLGGRGVALRYVSYNDWQARDLSTPDRKRYTGYMTGVPPKLKLTTRPGKPEVSVRSRWVGKFLTICDPVMTSTSLHKTLHARPQVERWLRGLPDSDEQDVDEPGSPQRPAGRLLRQLAPEEAVRASKAALDEYNSQIKPGGKVREERQALQPERPMLVEWLDEPGTYHLEAAYYIVPFRSNGVQNMAVRVAARTPFWIDSQEEQKREHRKLLLGINVLQKAQEERRQVSAIMTEESARDMIRGRSFRGTEGAGILVPKGFDGEGSLVWKPCVESFDPFCPFYEFEIAPHRGSEQPAYLYVRTFDGKVFTHMTEHYGGA